MLVRLLPLALALAGCGSTYRYPHYDVVLDGVAASGDRLDPAGSGILADGSPSFIDSDLRIAGRLTHHYIDVEMTNLTDRTVSHLWDRASIINLDGVSCRAIRGQTRILFGDRRLREAAEQAERGFRITLPVQVEEEVREYALRFRVDHLTFDINPEPAPPSFKP